MSIYRRAARGFTLVEIMIVVAIIALIAAITIPNLLRSRINANEAAAVSTLKSMATAMESYRAAQSPVTYPTTFTNLSGAQPGGGPAYLPTTVTGATAPATARQGYFYTPTLAASTYSILSKPASAGNSGVSTYFVDQTGIIRVDRTGADATNASTPVE